MKQQHVWPIAYADRSKLENRQSVEIQNFFAEIQYAFINRHLGIHTSPGWYIRSALANWLCSKSCTTNNLSWRACCRKWASHWCGDPQCWRPREAGVTTRGWWEVICQENLGGGGTLCGAQSSPQRDGSVDHPRDGSGAETVSWGGHGQSGCWSRREVTRA